MRKILFMGPQGSGKGTQSVILGKKLGLPAFSMGQLLRDLAAQGGEIGEEIAAIQKAGTLVPFEISLKALNLRLSHGDCTEGYIIDGFPRNFEQFQAFDKIDQPTDVVLLEIPREESLLRTLERSKIEGRADDTPEIIARRLDLYETDTKELIKEYAKRGIVREVDGMGTIEEVANRIEKLFV